MLIKIKKFKIFGLWFEFSCWKVCQLCWNIQHLINRRNVEAGKLCVNFLMDFQRIKKKCRKAIASCILVCRKSMRLLSNCTKTKFSGNPLIGFPTGERFTGSSALPSWSYEGIGISPSAECDQRLCLWNPQPFEKGWRKLHSVLLCTFFSCIGFSTNWGGREHSLPS